MVSAEYTLRYGKFHMTWKKLGKLLETAPKNIGDNGWNDPPQCMPDYCKKENTVDAYRNYYIQEKKYFAKWKFTKEPEWMLN